MADRGDTLIWRDFTSVPDWKQKMRQQPCCWMECHDCKSGWNEKEGNVSLLFKGTKSYPICEECSSNY